MSTGNDYGSKARRTTSLNSSEIMDLKRPQAGEGIELIVKKGVIRIAANQSENAEDLTLAFACKADVFKFNYPGDLDLKIEAMTDTTYFVETTNKAESKTNDAIMDWIIQLHILRHEANLRIRLMKFFSLLMTRLGKRTPEGMLLEHTISHARIAEIIGSTRSTVSRTLSSLRKEKKIYIDELRDRIILPVD